LSQSAKIFEPQRKTDTAAFVLLLHHKIEKKNQKEK
jgi:hypothetical protein